MEDADGKDLNHKPIFLFTIFVIFNRKILRRLTNETRNTCIGKNNKFVQEEGGRANLPSKGGRKKDERG